MIALLLALNMQTSDGFDTLYARQNTTIAVVQIEKELSMACPNHGIFPRGYMIPTTLEDVKEIYKNENPLP